MLTDMKEKIDSALAYIKIIPKEFEDNNSLIHHKCKYAAKFVFGHF